MADARVGRPLQRRANWVQQNTEVRGRPYAASDPERWDLGRTMTDQLPTRWGSVNEYSTTTAPVPSRLQGAQSGGMTSRVAERAWLGVVLTTAFSTARA